MFFLICFHNLQAQAWGSKPERKNNESCPKPVLEIYVVNHP
jgi:hypothetical protein